MTNQDLGTTNYAYNELNRLIAITNPDSQITNYSYNDVGALSQITEPNNVVTTYTYNNLNQLTDLVTADSSLATISSNAYDYNNAGMKTKVTLANDNYIEYDYDNIYQLTSEVKKNASHAVIYSHSYTYDDSGNRTQMIKDGVTTTYTYNDGNQLTTVNSPLTTIGYTYDNNGNLISETDGTNTTTYAWDYENKLTTVHSPLSTVSYGYDGNGNRISKTVDGVTTKYINDVGLPLVQVLFETNDEDTVLATYNYGNDLISMNRAGVNSYYHYDGLGSTRQLTDDTEAVVASYTYDAFGNVIASTGTTENAYGFTGEQQFNEADSLVYLRARYYDASIGRFISRDPMLKPMQVKSYSLWLLPYLIYHPQILNHYVYCRNNPINWIDPFGLEATDPGDLPWWQDFWNWLWSVMNSLGNPSPVSTQFIDPETYEGFYHFINHVEDINQNCE